MKREKLLVFVLTVRPFCCVGFSHMSKVTSLCVAILLRLVSFLTVTLLRENVRRNQVAFSKLLTVLGW